MGSAPSAQASSPVRSPVLLRQVGMLALLAGFIEVTGYLDLSSIYPGIMTGNNIQLGASLAQHLWRLHGAARALATTAASCLARSRRATGLCKIVT